MDGKEIKSLLKQARDSLKEKDYKTSLKHCKAVLKSDKNNYNAWVFVGAASQEIDQPDQSVAAFKKAIEIAPDQLLAWQGLCNFYEKNEKPEYVPELLSVYKKLIDLLESEKEKRLEFYDKLVTLVKSLHDKEKLFKVLRSKLEVVKGDFSQEISVHKQIFDALSGQTHLTEYEKQTLTEALDCIINQENFTEADVKRVISSCIEHLFKNGYEQYSLSLALKIHAKFQDSPSCLVFLCRLAMKLCIDNDNSVMESVEEISKRLSDLDSSKGIALIFQGFSFFLLKKFVAAIQKIKEGLKSVEFCLEGWYFLSKSHLMLHQYKDAERSSKIGVDTAIKSKADSKMIGKFYLILGQALSGKQNFNAAIKSLEKCVQHLGHSKEIMISFCLTLLKIEEVDKAEKICHDLKQKYPGDANILQVEGYLLLLKKDYTKALLKLKESVKIVEIPYTLHLIGMVLWESEQRDKAFKVFSKAVELDPYFAKNFLFLGNYYRNNLLDKSKACLCYQKAFSLDNSDCEIGMCYSQILKDLGKEEENMKVLKIITEQASLGSCKWAWTQLGLYQLKDNPSDAIFSLQNAVRADPNSSHAWECLADAYLKRGSYESALKAFERAAEINTKAMYPLYQIATIQKLRGFYVEAVEKYQNLLEIAPNYVPALIGLAETLVLSAKKSFENCLYGLARDNCQKALNVLARVAATNTGLSSLWKLAGDACSIPFHFDTKWFPLTVPHELHQNIETNAISCNKADILSFATKFFGRAIVIKDNVSTLWHDLGVSYYYQSLLPGDPSTKLELSKKAFICFQKAVTINAEFQAHWIALGVVAVGKELNDKSLGQHSFIQSLQINPNNAEIWTNLGVLYLENGCIELSNAAFVKAQSAEPTYPLSWIGQAFIADKIKHAETMDLYRHATTLGSHTEALLGYSRLVCKALIETSNKSSESYRYNIEQMNAVVTAADCATKFISNKNDVPEAFNILGMLLERLGIYNASLNSYKRALDLFHEADKIEGVKVVRANYARLLCVTGQVNEAIKEFLLLKKVDSSLLCSFAMAFFKAKQYEQALKLFKQAFEMAKCDGDKSHIKVAMAFVARNLQGPEYPNPLTLLFESSQIVPASVPGLLALRAVGILKDERALALAAQKELNPYKYKKDYCSSIALLWASQAYLQRGASAGRNELLKFTHCVPNNGEMWLQMASCLLQWNTEYAKQAAFCTKVGNFHSGSKEQLSQIFALCQMSEGYRKGALSAAQKAVHVNPAKLSNWVTLAAACHVAEKDRKNTGWMFSFVKKLAKEQGIKSDLLGVLIVLEAFHYICEENFAGANSLLTKALSVSSFNADTQSALQILDAVVKVFTNNGNLEALVIALKNNSKSFLGWHILCQLLLSSGRFFEAEKTISKFAITAEKIFPKWTTFPLLQLAVLSYKAMNANVDEREKWLKLGEEMTGKAVYLSPSSQAARFMQGLFALESGNSNLARRSFEKVLSDPVLKEPKWMESAAKFIIESKNLKRKVDVNQGSS